MVEKYTTSKAVEIKIQMYRDNESNCEDYLHYIKTKLMFLK